MSPTISYAAPVGVLGGWSSLASFHHRHRDADLPSKGPACLRHGITIEQLTVCTRASNI